MSKTGEEYIKKINAEEDERLSKRRLASDCCLAEVEPCLTIAGETSPPEPYYICLKCERRCDVLVIDENEEEEI